MLGRSLKHIFPQNPKTPKPQNPSRMFLIEAENDSNIQ